MCNKPSTMAGCWGKNEPPPPPPTPTPKKKERNQVLATKDMIPYLFLTYCLNKKLESIDHIKSTKYSNACINTKLHLTISTLYREFLSGARFLVIGPTATRPPKLAVIEGVTSSVVGAGDLSHGWLLQDRTDTARLSQ